MIVSALSEDQNQRTSFIPVRDYLYNENAWLAEIQQKVKIVTNNSKSVVLIGHLKDDSSYYLKTFPQWDFEETRTRLNLAATDIRHDLFSQGLDKEIANRVPLKVWDYLHEWRHTPIFRRLQEEYDFLQDYKASWAVTKDIPKLYPEVLEALKVLEGVGLKVGVPYPVTFVTTDAVVIKSGHVLVVQRGRNPGKGLIALPGGFLGQSESILTSCIRELREETKVKVSDAVLRKALVSEHVFDHPQRSQRGRTITHAHLFDLGLEGDLPQVKGSDDADRAFWMPLGDVYSGESLFFEDHREIIFYFLSK
jgi:bifunctional NMN adenylyltransferase/nudix hydrolase